MNLGILGSGDVAQALAAGGLKHGHGRWPDHSVPRPSTGSGVDGRAGCRRQPTNHDSGSCPGPECPAPGSSPRLRASA
jgi:hypothetical protein